MKLFVAQPFSLLPKGILSVEGTDLHSRELSPHSFGTLRACCCFFSLYSFSGAGSSSCLVHSRSCLLSEHTLLPHPEQSSLNIQLLRQENNGPV